VSDSGEQNTASGTPEKVERPAIVTDEHLEFLDDLRESGVTNMWGAGSYLRRRFRKLTEEQSSVVLAYWMRSFSERHPDER
jgi:hypothetical protein